MHRVVRGVLAGGATLLLLTGLSTAAGASGGGGCGRPVTDARGSTVRIHEFCFLPTILRVHPGQTVAFHNRDGVPHVVLGANAVWGSFTQVRTDRAVRYRFVRPGVYPYICTIHPGMVGAVVVGGGRGHGEATATVTASGPVVPVDDVASAPRVISSGATAATTPAVTSGWMAPWELVALVLFAAGVAGFVVVEGRRARHTA